MELNSIILMIFVCLYLTLLKFSFVEILLILGFFQAQPIIQNTYFRLSLSHILVALYLIIYIFFKEKFKLGNKMLLLIYIYIPIAFLLNYFIVNPETLFFSQNGKVTFYKDKNILDFIKHYLLFSLCYISYLLSYNSKKINLDRVYKQVLNILVFFSMLQILFWFLKLNYNNLIRPDKNTFPQAVIWGGKEFVRISPLSLEPSMFVMGLLILGIYFLQKKDLKRIFLVIILGTITKTSTFTIGIIIIFLFIIFQKKNTEIFKNIFIIISINIFLFIFVPVYKEIIIELIHKLLGQGESGRLRLNSMKLNLNSLKTNFFIGIGFGFTRSADLLSTWLLNLGFIGVFIFIKAIFKSYNKQYKVYWNQLAIFFICSMISVPEPYYFYIWIIWGNLDLKINKLNQIKK